MHELFTEFQCVLTGGNHDTITYPFFSAQIVPQIGCKLFGRWLESTVVISPVKIKRTSAISYTKITKMTYEMLFYCLEQIVFEETKSTHFFYILFIVSISEVPITLSLNFIQNSWFTKYIRIFHLIHPFTDTLKSQINWI